MIFFIGNTGTVTYSFPTPVYQGSDDANNIYVVAPFAQNLTATAAFTLPNGVYTEPYNLTYKGEISGIQGADGKPLYGWQMSIPNDLTQYYGTVLVQFSFYSAAGRINTAAGSFTVGRGVAAALPATPSADVYGQILSLIATLQQDLGNSYYSAKALREYPVSGAEYADGDFVILQESGDYFLGVLENGEMTPIFNFTGVMNELPDIVSQVTAAQAAAEAAQAAAEAAETAAQEAAAQASESATSAQNAQTVAENAQTAADGAQTAAESAASSAQTASSSAQAAQEAAQSSATAAQNSANAAQEAANSFGTFQDQIDGIYTVLNATVTNEVTVSEVYTSRETAGGLDIIDGALTQVESIQGDTVACNNLISWTEFFTGNEGVVHNGLSLTFNNGTFHLFGTFTQTEKYTQWGFTPGFTLLSNKTYSMKINNSAQVGFSILTSGIASNVRINAGATFGRGIPTGNSSNVSTISFNTSTLEEGQEVDFTFTPWIVEGGYTNETMPPYQPYFTGLKNAFFTSITSTPPAGSSSTTDTLSVSTPIELTKYDTAYPAENKVVRGGATLTQETPFTAEQLAQYTEYVLSQDGMTIVYKLAEPTEETVVFNKFFYKAYSGGMEYITQGATDNSEYGAECNVTQIYIEQKGGTQS